MQHTTESLLPMDGRLRADHSGMYRDELLDRLKACENEIRGKLDAGMAPDEFQAVRKLHLAVSTSRTVIQAVWNFFHP